MAYFLDDELHGVERRWENSTGKLERCILWAQGEEIHDLLKNPLSEDELMLLCFTHSIKMKPEWVSKQKKSGNQMNKPLSFFDYQLSDNPTKKELSDFFKFVKEFRKDFQEERESLDDWCVPDIEQELEEYQKKLKYRYFDQS